MRRPEGSSLVEVLISGSIGLVILGAVFGVFAAARTFFQQANEVSGFYEDAVKTLHRLALELEESNGWLINQTGSNPPALAFPSARDTQKRFVRDAEGRPAWSRWILYYVASQGSDLVLVRKEYGGLFPPTPPVSIPAQLLTPPLGVDQIVARDLSLFEVTTTHLDDGRQRCQVQLLLSRPTRRPDGVTVTHTQRFQRAVIVRNPP